MKTLIYRSVQSLGFLALMLLASCSTGGARPSTNVATPISFGTEPPNILDIHTSTPTFTLSPPPSTPTPTLEGTETVTAAPQPSPTSTPTWTPAPTLSSQAAQALVQQMLNDNGGCEFPCWWGMVPGETRWDTARHFLETFATAFKQGGEGYRVVDGQEVYGTNYSIIFPLSDSRTVGFIVDIRNEFISGFLVNPVVLETYYLPALLTEFGEPETVLIYTHRVTPTGSPPPFHLILYYPEKGIFATYELTGKVTGGKVIGCPKDERPFIDLWSPQGGISLDDLLRSAGFGPDLSDTSETPKDIETAAGMDEAEFYRLFSDPATSTCIKTPADLWN